MRPSRLRALPSRRRRHKGTSEFVDWQDGARRITVEISAISRRHAMKSRLFMMLILAAVVVGFAGTMSAHHGANLYDSTKAVMMKGTITQFEWGNPHNQIYFDVKDDKGTVTHWVTSTEPPAVMTEQGWT